MGSDGSRKLPSLSLTAVRVTPVSVWVAVMVAPGNAEPSWAVTVPTRLAPAVWACATGASAAPTASTNARARRASAILLRVMFGILLGGWKRETAYAQAVGAV